MAKTNRLKYTEIVLLVLVWLVLLASPLLFRKEDSIGWEGLTGPLQTIIPLIILFLVNRFLLVPQLLLKKRNFQYFLTLGTIIAFMTIGVFFTGPYLKDQHGPVEHTGQQHQPPPHLRPLNHGTAPPPPQEPRPQRGGPIPPFANFLIFSILLIGFDTGLRSSFKLAETERIRDKLEKSNVESQLAFLRNQVSPHFFMNTLNNIHSLIDFDTAEAKESVIRLSKLMRHLLYDSEAEKIPIQKELDFIRNYVELMTLRYTEKVKVELKVPDQVPEKSIPPLLFTSFLENAFKYGVSYQHASFIDISFSFSDDMLIFEIVNSTIPMEKAGENSGIGIENSRKRLDLLYGDKYELKIKDTRDEYYVRLTIPL